jgi:hypothetical protein
MNTNARIMLQALQHSCNETTSESARALLTGAKMPWAPEGVSTEELAVAGRLGGFIAAVMTGDLREAYRAGDVLNQLALENVVPEAFR